MAAAALTLREAVVVRLPPGELFSLFAEPEALLAALEADQVTCRKLGNAERWVIGHPEKLGEKVIDLRLAATKPPERLTWIATLRGFEIETGLRFEPHKRAATRLHLVSKVQAKSLRAKLMAPLLKLARKRLKRGLRRNLRDLAEKLGADPS